MITAHGFHARCPEAATSPTAKPAKRPSAAVAVTVKAALPATQATPFSSPPAPTPAPTPSQAPAVQQPSGDPQAYALSLVGSAEFSCLQPLWNRESGWRWDAANAGSGAYGIPQALPGDKMAAAGADWQTNPDTQIRWGVLDYINPVYGNACNALGHENAFGWY